MLVADDALRTPHHKNVPYTVNIIINQCTCAKIWDEVYTNMIRPSTLVHVFMDSQMLCGPETLFAVGLRTSERPGRFGQMRSGVGLEM